MGNKVINKVGPKLGIYETDTDEQLSASLGQVREFEDGRKFRLCQNSTTALEPGLLVQTKPDTAYTEDIVVTTAGGVGGKTVTVTNFAGHEALSENELTGGYLCVGVGEGEVAHYGKIKFNTAAIAGADTTITLYDALIDTISTDSTVAWTYPIYKNVVVATTTGMVVGCPILNVAASTSTVPVFFWAQTHGACSVLAGGTVSAGNMVNSDDNGAVIDDAVSGTGAASVGRALQSFDDTDYGFIYLDLD